MARDFDGSADDLRRSSAVVTATPLSIGCWFNSDVVSGDAGVLVWIGDQAFGQWRAFYLHAFIGSNVQANAAQNNVFEGAVSTTAPSQSTWHHVLGVFASSTSRAVYLDGGGKGTDVDSITPTNLDFTMVGAAHAGASPGSRVDGRIAEVAVWDIDLTDDDAVVLARGFSPLFVRPGNLVDYWPIIGRTSPEIDRVGGADLTVTSDPPASAHPRIIYPAPPLVGYTTPAAGGGSVPVFMHSYRRRRAA